MHTKVLRDFNAEVTRADSATGINEREWNKALTKDIQ